MRLSGKLSEKAVAVTTVGELEDWLRAVDKEIGGLRWVPLGGKLNNVHTVQASSDSALALVERPVNCEDALLDLKALELNQTAPSPHAAAKAWWNVPTGGLSEMREEDRRRLAELIRVSNLDSGELERPTIVIRDCGTGQHPDDFANTLLSLLESNKKSKAHQMGVYNAGGAASYGFSTHTIIISRRAPHLLAGKPDEIGITVVRYNPLDPDRDKTGTYEYFLAKDKTILRADLPGVPEHDPEFSGPGYGTYVKHINYELSKYHRAAHEPKRSLWHLFHAALVDPPLPFRIVETRTKYFPGMKGNFERRVVMGLLHLLRRAGTADYQEERVIPLSPEEGRVVLRYFVLNDGTDPDAYTTSEQGVTVTLNGQRHGTKDRYWVKRQTDLHYIYKRLILFADCNDLTNTAKRQVFASTREHQKDTPLTRKILELVVQELRDDEDLHALDDAAMQRAQAEATRSTSERVKRQLASQVAALLHGELPGQKGGRKRKPVTKRRKARRVLNVDDSAMLDIPDQLAILSDPLTIELGGRAVLRLGINAKNGFLPKYASALQVVLPTELKDKVKVYPPGKLLGGRVRLTVRAGADTPLTKSNFQVALVEPSLPVLLTATGTIEIVSLPAASDEESAAGGAPDVDILWHERAAWETFDPHWDENTVGTCVVTRDTNDPSTVTRVVWNLNKGFSPYENALAAKKLGEQGTKLFQEAYEYPVCWGMFQQALAEYEKERQADEEGRPIQIPDDYVRSELARLARAVLIAKEADVAIAASVAN